MNKTKVMKQLQAMGTAQHRKTFARHGITGDVFGVSYANLGKLKRQIKMDQELAEQLWATGNHDARVLASMIADPSRMTATKLDAWVKQADNSGTTAALSDLAAKCPTARKRVEKWTRSKSEWVGVTGWHALASLARDEAVPDDVIDGYPERIEAEIRTAENQTRYAMNNALIAIGISRSKLRKKAIAIAKRIGKVEVDHGDTSCKTPDAVSHIAKGVARQAEKAPKRKANKRATATR